MAVTLWHHFSRWRDFLKQTTPDGQQIAHKGLVSVHFLKERKMSIQLTAEQKTVQTAWLPSLTRGDEILIFYDHSTEGQVPATIIKNDGGWITALPDSKEDAAENYIKFCAVSGNGAYYGAIVPPAMRQELVGGLEPNFQISRG